MLLDKNEIDRLRDRLDILQVAQRLGLSLHRGMTTCLWHADKTPSMQVSTKRQTCHCWSCGKTADVYELVQRVQGCGFREAYDWLRREAGAIEATTVTDSGPRRQPRQYPPDVAHLASLVQHPYLSAEARHFLYDERRIDERVVRWCRLSSITVPMPYYRGGRPFYDAPSLLIPYFGEDGRLLSVQSRYLGERHEGVVRFRFPPHTTGCSIYGRQVLPMLRGDEPLQLCEGPTDTLSALSAGTKAIGITSATALRDDDLVSALRPHLAHWHGPLLCYPDNDRAGQQLLRQLQRIARALALPLDCREVQAGCKDFGEMWAGQVIYKN